MRQTYLIVSRSSLQPVNLPQLEPLTFDTMTGSPGCAAVHSALKYAALFRFSNGDPIDQTSSDNS